MVRKLPPVLAISAAVHAAALAWVAAYTPTRALLVPVAPPTVIELVERAPMPEAAPIDVAFLDAPATAAATAPPTTLVAPLAAPLPAQNLAPAQVGRARPPIAPPIAPPQAITTSATATDVALATGPVVRNRYLEMRGPGSLSSPRPGDARGPRIELPRLEWNPDMPPGPPPPRDETTGQLDPSGRGTYRSDQGPFVAKVAADGSVKLKDKRNLNIHLALPSPKDLGHAIADWYTDPNKPVGMLPPDHIETAPYTTEEDWNRTHGTRVSGGGGLGGGGTQDDEQVRMAKKGVGDVATVPILAGGFDVSDALMRRHGMDPYASKKLAFLDSTRAERVQIGMRHRAEQLAMAPEIMKRNLDRLWGTIAAPAARREVLFELWDECAESGTDELSVAGHAARLLVIGWIQAKLPAGSALAYPPEELTAFNAKRTSKARFAPY